MLIRLDATLDLTDTKGIPVSIKIKISLSSVSTPATIAPQDNTYLEIGGAPAVVVNPKTSGRKAKAARGVAYEGLKRVVDALYDCSDVFPPLKSAAAVFRTIIKFVEVCVLMYTKESGFIHRLFLPIRLHRRISRNSKISKRSWEPSSRSLRSIKKTAEWTR